MVRDCDTCAPEMKPMTDTPCRTCADFTNWCPVGVVGKRSIELDLESTKHFGHPVELKLPPWITGETDPRGTDAHAPGAKLDAGKVLAGVLADFSLALLAVAEVGTHGAEKYSRGGWQSVPDGETRYKDADWRHLLKGRHEDSDPDSGLLHEAHRAWNVPAALELRLRREKGE